MKKRLLLMGLLALSLTGCQGWLTATDQAIHGPDEAIEENHRMVYGYVLPYLERDYAEWEDANLGVDPLTGQPPRENLERWFRGKMKRARMYRTVKQALRANALYDGVDLDTKPGKTRSEAEKRMGKLSKLLQDAAKDAGKDAADSLQGDDE